MDITLEKFVSSYKSNRDTNHHIWQEFSAYTDTVDFLKSHRDYIEKKRFGFGDRAFHFMWFLLIKDMARQKPVIKALEIGVFKGQVISLWSLIGQKLGLNVEITGISPLRGNTHKNKLLDNKLVRKLRCLVDPEFKKLLAEGNNYVDQDYKRIIELIFKKFALDINSVKLIQGFSQEPHVLRESQMQKYDIIYIDGDHSFEAVTLDIKNYAALLESGGYLVMDDASYFLEGDIYFKGHKEVSEASSIIESLGFKNILNVGHNRVYKKL